jgi:hypothetical protein
LKKKKKFEEEKTRIRLKLQKKKTLRKNACKFEEKIKKKIMASDKFKFNFFMQKLKGVKFLKIIKKKKN